ncbi:MATE family efflux transporter [Dehalobacter sp. DCM]|uniref:MATE family efflux transporter n=1 Tax=Dehalobacter sp. DCM TaxID=2907827 RepID=UPI0030816246|nr:MATE family efflux transporter [Dehalobacter sp. DCM]
MNKDMGSLSVGKLLWQFSWPTIIGMLVNALYNIVDRIFVGRALGSLAIAATTVAFPIMLVFFAVSMLIGVGATALISIRLGEQKKAEAEQISGNALVLLVFIPLLLSLIYLFFPEQILIMFGANDDVLPYALEYTNVIVLGSVFGAISFGLNNFIRAEGKPKISMMTQLLGAFVNVILNYVFIFELGMGMKGSALGTIIGQCVSACWVLGYFLFARSTLKLRLKNFKPDPLITRRILAIGFAPFAMQIAGSVQQMLLNKSVMTFGGDLALSAVGVVMSLSTIFFMPIVGISQGAQPIIGYNYGAKQFSRVTETLKKAALIGICLATAGFFVIRLWPEQIIGLFSNGDAALTEIAVHAMLTFLALLPVLGFQIVAANYFQAVGKPLQSTILTLSRQVLIFIPLLLILPNFWGIEGVWRTAPIADALSILLTISFIFIEMKSLLSKQRVAEVNTPA